MGNSADRAGLVSTTHDVEFLGAIPEDDSALGERERVASALFGGAATPRTIGRYRVEDMLGRGAMGVVYEAWDEELQRTVAVKLISRDAEVGRAEHRFRREALALAKLAHPNVVTVHEVGLHEGRLFIAMELVRGQTLDVWLRGESRTWQDTLDVFAQAGRGLDAAHRAGLVHRDFKPANCIVGESGRVRVLDFGLARGAADLLDEDAAATFPTASSLDVSVTRTGATIGTPAYMAPEQLRGGEVSAASDQFSFCVALYEALEGVRPFAGKCIVDIHRNIEVGRLQRGATSAPEELLHIVERGLSLAPGDRWPTVAALIDALMDVPERRSRRLRRWWMASAGAVAVAAVGVSMTPQEPCKSLPTSRVWSAQRRASLEGAMGDSAAWRTLDDEVTRWSRAWTDAHAAACKAARVEERTTELVLTRQRACLEQREKTVDALLDALSRSASPRVHGGDAVRLLPTLEDCRSTDATVGVEGPPPGSAADVDTARNLLDQSVASLMLGDVEKAATLAEAADRVAEKVGHAPLRADVGLLRGRIGRERDPDAGAAFLRAAFKHGESSAYDAAAADAALLLALVSLDRDDAQSARRWWDVAEAKLERTAAGPQRRTRLSSVEALISLRVGDVEAADVASADALRYCAEASGDTSLLCADVLATRARVVEGTRSPDEAEVAHGQALQALRGLLGPMHPSVGVALLNRGLFRMEVGYLDAAAADFDAALPLLDAAELPRVVAQLWMARAQLDSMRGELDLATLERADEILGAYPADDPQRAEYEAVLAAFYLRSKRAARALEIYERLLGVHQRTSEPIPAVVAMDHSNIGECLIELGRLAEARARFDLSLDRLETAVSSDDPRLSYPLTGLGRVLLEQGRNADAQQVLERSLAIATEHPGDVLLIGQTQWALARAVGLDSARGRSLASASRDGFLAADDEMSAQLVLNALDDEREQKRDESD